nr:unnamed protein product [Callosobruchus chinensis]
MATIWRVLTRKKVLDEGSVEETRLSRVLSTYDLTALGVGSTLGVGVYVLAGHVAKDTAGPSVVLSFLIAAVASLFAGLCYAEFGARVPKAGSAYVYSYVCVGEFVAFVIGWNLILEYVIGSASVARGLSLYLDTLINNTMQNAFIEVAPIDIPYLSKYFDFFACSISIILAVALAMGIKESSFVNNIITILNILVILFVIIAGSTEADIANWEVDPNKVINGTHVGKGGFFPFGVEGMIKGAATCFYGFVGFDCIATTGEEVRNPKRAIPISIMLSLFIIFLSYFGISTVVTLMLPYYEQNPDAPIPYAFEAVNWNAAKWIVSIGAIFGLCASLFGAMFPLPRVIYAMAEDSLVFRFLGHVHPRFQTPLVGTLLAGILTGLMAALFELKQLVNMMSIGTLLAYTIVAASVLLLRYSEDKTIPAVHESVETSDLLTYEDSDGIMGQIFNCGRRSQPTRLSEKIAAIDLSVYCVMCIFIGLCAIYLKEPIANGEVWAISLTSLAVFLAVIVIMSLVTQPTSRKELSFKVPAVPLIPALSILTNIYLMLMLDSHTWIRFAVWMAVGLPIYYFSHKPYTEAQNRAATVSDDKKNGVTNGISRYYHNTAFEDTEKVPGCPSDNLNNITSEIEQELEKLDEMLNKVDNSTAMPRDLSGLCPAFCVETHSVHDLNESSVIPSETTISSVSDENMSKSSIVEVSGDNRIQTVAEIEHHEHSVTVDTVENNRNEECITGEAKRKHSNLTGGMEDLDKIEIISEDSNNNESEGSIEVMGDSTDSAIPVNQESTKNDGGSKESDTEILKEDRKEEISDITDTTINGYNGNSTSEDTRYNSEKKDIEAILDVPDIQKSIEQNSDTSMNQEPTECDPNIPRIEAKASESIAETVNPDLYEANSKPDSNQKTDELNADDVQLRATSPAPSIESDDDNLIVGSPKYKVFLDNLNKKLSRYTVIPTYVSPSSKPRKVQEDADRRDGLEKGVKQNENVLEESINTAVAREKLLAFINAGHSSPGAFRKQETSNFDFPEMKGDGNEVAVDSESEKHKQSVDGSTMPNNEIISDKSDSNENVQHIPNSFESIRENADSITVDRIEDEPDDYSLHKNRMQNVFRSVNLKRKDSVDSDHSEIKGNTIALINTDKSKEHMREIFNNTDEIASDEQKDIDDYTLHKTRMQNVFRSVNLKRKDSLDREKSESRRKSKTVSLMNEDKFKHRQAMSDIFKTINLKRKDSTDLVE